MPAGGSKTRLDECEQTKSISNTPAQIPKTDQCRDDTRRRKRCTPKSQTGKKHETRTEERRKQVRCGPPQALPPRTRSHVRMSTRRPIHVERETLRGSKKRLPMPAGGPKTQLDGCEHAKRRSNTTPQTPETARSISYTTPKSRLKRC